MPTPTSRHDSSLIQFRVKTPADVRDKAWGRMLLVELPAFGDERAVTVTARIGEHVKFSLRTRDPAAAKVRHGAALVHVARAWDGFRGSIKFLGLREIVALSGDVYRLFLDECGDEPGDANNWIAVRAFNRAVAQGRILLAPTLRPLPHHANEIEIARDLFEVDLSRGIDAHPAGVPSLDALESRFGLLANWTSCGGRSMSAPRIASGCCRWSNAP